MAKLGAKIKTKQLKKIILNIIIKDDFKIEYINGSDKI